MSLKRFLRSLSKVTILISNMPRRESKNRTNIARVTGIPVHEALVSYVCVKCSALNFVRVGNKLLNPAGAYENQSWTCENCGFIHSKVSPLPLKTKQGKKLPFAFWKSTVTKANSLATQRFWKAFFTTTTEAKDAYWKQCNTCGRKLPARAFSGHKDWGPLEKQMECRSCKAVINTNLNPKRTK